MKITCPSCTTVLDVGDEVRSIVAICKVRNKDCTVKQWGSPKTRVECASDADFADKEGNPVIAHVLQTDPPETEKERKTRPAPFYTGDPFDSSRI